MTRFTKTTRPYRGRILLLLGSSPRPAVRGPLAVGGWRGFPNGTGDRRCATTARLVDKRRDECIRVAGRCCGSIELRGTTVCGDEDTWMVDFERRLGPGLASYSGWPTRRDPCRQRLSACCLADGRAREVVWQYRPPGLTAGVIVSLFAWLILAVMALPKALIRRLFPLG